jgi:hypothetical protein
MSNEDVLKKLMNYMVSFGNFDFNCTCIVVQISWGDFSLFCLDSMRSTVSAKSSQLCGDKVSLSNRPWMSYYIMQCVSWLWTVFWPSSDYFPGEWRWAIYSIMQVWSARNSNMHGDLEQIANWVEAPRSSSKHPWSKGWNPLMFRLHPFRLLTISPTTHFAYMYYPFCLHRIFLKWN